ncbi:hypothetical protein IEQ34_003833 [Dendrobium chrysotoxum]|uniref:Uncharacterized protein n=1 Tax=Dendrobium chrysotoxum TaxID=161865 RepID=A0AAV7HGQ7_DENCH|nr:hypothetical protein IEQ34_003833 [Dendrobium chrysotoxum]
MKLYGLYLIGLWDSRHVAIQLILFHVLQLHFFNNSFFMLWVLFLIHQVTVSRIIPSFAHILVEADISKKHLKEILLRSKFLIFIPIVKFVDMLLMIALYLHPKLKRFQHQHGVVDGININRKIIEPISSNSNPPSHQIEVLKDLPNDDVLCISKNVDKIVHGFNITDNVVDLNEYTEGPELIFSHKSFVDTAPVVHMNVALSQPIGYMVNLDAIQEQNQSQNGYN